jgi:L-rhamnonate dehydratase
MRITQVRAVQPPTPRSPRDWRTTFGQILVVVQTDEGLLGYGVGGGGPAGIYVVDTLLRDVLLGADPLQVEPLWHRMYRAILPLGRRGLSIMALSGADLALWDLRGKAAGKPVAELLGGSVHRAVPAYITLADDPAAALDQGFRAFKLHCGLETVVTDARQLLHRVRQARQTIGPDAMLMVDAFMSWDVPSTLRWAAELADCRLAWIEEPLSPDDLDGYAELVRSCPTPIAGGEHEYTPWGFQPLIDRRLHHVLQPDVCWCGGLTPLIEIYRLAHARGLRVCPHRGAEPWPLHAIVALDPQPLAESGRPWLDWVGNQPAIRHGLVQLTDQPGFGVEIAEYLWR